MIEFKMIGQVCTILELLTSTCPAGSKWSLFAFLNQEFTFIQWNALCMEDEISLYCSPAGPTWINECATHQCALEITSLQNV